MKSRGSKKRSWCFNCRKKPQTMDSDLSDQETTNDAEPMDSLVTSLGKRKE